MTTASAKPIKTEFNRKPIESFTDRIICGDVLQVLKTLPDYSVDCVVTSPPYWALRDYGVKGQIGLEASLEEYLEKLLDIFAEVRRVLKQQGTCWVNFGDTYANKTKGGYKGRPQNNIFDSLNRRAAFPQLKANLTIPPKSLCQIPARFAIRMIEQGWILRNEIIWHKPNAMPQSFKDRFTVDFEKLFFFVKSKDYYFRQQYEPLKLTPRLSDFLPSHKSKKAAKNDRRIRVMNAKSAWKSYYRVKLLGRNKRCVWTISTSQFKGAHFAVVPERLVETPINAGCPESGIVLDPFMGSGTTAVASKKLSRQFIGIDLNPAYIKIARQRLAQVKLDATNKPESIRFKRKRKTAK